MSTYHRHHSYSYTALPSPPPTYSSSQMPSKVPSAYMATMALSPPEKHQHRTQIESELRPISLPSNNMIPFLPPIHHIAMSSPSPSNNSDSFSDSTFSSPPSTTSPSFSSSVPPSTIQSPLLSDSCRSTPFPPSPQQRKGSIASLLNSDPELRQLDEEEHKCGYQSHFMNVVVGVKRSLPPQKRSSKKQRAADYSPPQATTTTSLVLNERGTKGLRHFSKKVCDKVKEHGVTTYDQVVHELTCDLSSAFCPFDQKNIRRRVYDALNVLMAMNIIAKDKKEIKWLGIPACYATLQKDDIVETPNMDDPEDCLLLQQIYEEEARNKKLLASMNSTRLSVRDSLTMYLQLRRLIYRNQHESRSDSLMVMNLTKGSKLDLSLDQKQTLVSMNCSTDLQQMDVLNHQFQQGFSSQELNWLPDSTWHRYLS